MRTQTNLKFLIILLIHSLFFIACTEEDLTSQELEGQYQIYSSNYFGLAKGNTNNTITLKKDSVAISKGCILNHGKWYKEGNNVMLIFKNFDSTSSEDYITQIAKIETKNRLVIKRILTVNSKDLKDSLYVDYIMLK